MYAHILSFVANTFLNDSLVPCGGHQQINDSWLSKAYAYVYVSVYVCMLMSKCANLNVKQNQSENIKFMVLEEKTNFE